MTDFLRIGVASLALALSASVAATSAAAQAPTPASPLPDVPTTRVLAIGHVDGPNPAAAKGVMAGEVDATVRLYLTGKVAAWYVRKDRPGVVFVLDVGDVAQARALLHTLPLERSGTMAFDLIPLGPLAPLGLLLPKP